MSASEEEEWDIDSSTASDNNDTKTYYLTPATIQTYSFLQW